MAFKLFGQIQAGREHNPKYILQFQIIAMYEVRLADLDGSVNSNSEKLPHKSATHTGSIMVNCAIFGGSKL